LSRDRKIRIKVWMILDIAVSILENAFRFAWCSGRFHHTHTHTHIGIHDPVVSTTCVARYFFRTIMTQPGFGYYSKRRGILHTPGNGNRCILV
jgi:hypothetical protein